MNISLKLYLFFCLLLTGLTGCGGNHSDHSPAQSAERSPQRIICGSPAVAEIVFALDCGERVAGVSDYTTYPSEALDVAKIGGWMNPSRERLLRLKPDLIITQGQHPALAAFANEYDIRFHSVNLDDLDNILKSMAEIAEKLGAAERGAELVSSMTGAIAGLSERIEPVETVSVMLVMGRTPGNLGGIATVGPRTFIDELITLAGGSNIFQDATGPYPQISKESLLTRAPEVIIEVHSPGLPAAARRMLLDDWHTFDTVPAVANKRIYLIEEQLLLIPGPRVVEAAEHLARLIHPDRFHD